MAKNLSVGELVYVPTNVSLFKFNNYGKNSTNYYNQIAPQGRKLIEEPLNLLVADVTSLHVGVVYNGEVWYVDQRDVYNE